MGSQQAPMRRRRRNTELAHASFRAQGRLAVLLLHHFFHVLARSFRLLLAFNVFALTYIKAYEKRDIFVKAHIWTAQISGHRTPLSSPRGCDASPDSRVAVDRRGLRLPHPREPEDLPAEGVTASGVFAPRRSRGGETRGPVDVLPARRVARAAGGHDSTGRHPHPRARRQHPPRCRPPAEEDRLLPAGDCRHGHLDVLQPGATQ